MNYPSAPQSISAATFRAEVLESKLPVLVEFSTPWSPACRVFDTVLNELASELAGRMKVVKVNADDCLELSLCFEVQSIPTLICFVDGKLRVRIVGTASKEAILSRIEPYAGKPDGAVQLKSESQTTAIDP